MPDAQTPTISSGSPSVWGPRTWPLHLVGLVCVLAAAGLGWWQVEAWQAQRAAEARDLTEVEPVPVTEVMGPDDVFPADRVGMPVELAGTWVPEGTVHVDGREHDGRDGYWVVTPLEIGPGDSAMLVARGWTASLDDLPPPPTGEAALTGRLQPAEGRRGMVDQEPGDDVIPQLRIADALQHVDQDLYDGYVVVSWAATAEAGGSNAGTDGLAEASADQLPEVGRFTALRNLLYAVEWWVFGAFAGFVWWRWVRDQQALAEEAEAGGGDGPPTDAT